MSANKYYNLAKNELFDLCRSITGKGTFQTLNIIKKKISNLKIISVKSGTKVFDWKIPPEWNISAAYVIDNTGKKIIDFKNNNLHILNYSAPTNKIINRDELLKKTFSLPDQPNAIPYVTSYYKKNWGFCISDIQKKQIKSVYKSNDKFKVVIDTSFNKNGKLKYGEILIKGKSKQEIIISTYICHPSMANNELSGVIVSMMLIDYFKKNIPEKTLRFIFVPETIGAITFLDKNLINLKNNIIGGYVISCIGDERNHSCIMSKYGNSFSDISLLETYKKLNIKFKKYSFLYRGSDERQFNSPGIDIGVSTISRTRFGDYKEYHTSLDDFKLVTKKGINDGFKVAKMAIINLSKKIIPMTDIKCEPFMTKRNLYKTLSTKKTDHKIRDIMNFIQYSDGKNDLKLISKHTNLSLSKVQKVLKLLIKNKLVKI